MSTTSHRPRGRYFEEFEPGQRTVTAGRTITEADVVNFAGMSGDFNQIHMDSEYSQTSPFQQRVAHGLLVLSVASGLAVQSGVLEETVIAFREISDWKFVKPVFLGDTVHVELVVVETKAIPRISGGSVIIAVDVLNQDGVSVMRGKWNTLVASQPG